MAGLIGSAEGAKLDQSSFFKNVVDYYSADGFCFLVPGAEFKEPKKLPVGLQFLAQTASAFAFGLFGPSVGYANKFDAKDVAADLENMRDYCDLVGINFKLGGVQLQVCIDADNLAGELLIGRCAIIHDRAHDFQNKYAVSLMKTWLHDKKNGVQVMVLTSFSEHRKARDFIQGYANKCKHLDFRKAITTNVCVVDLDDHDITIFGTGFGWERERNKLLKVILKTS